MTTTVNIYTAGGQWYCAVWNGDEFDTIGCDDNASDAIARRIAIHLTSWNNATSVILTLTNRAANRR